MIITASIEFSSAHLYENKNWDLKTNLEKFGRCHTPYGHGHNYYLSVNFESSAQKSMSSLYQFQLECQQLLVEVTSELEHHHLNFEVNEFKNKVPTTENIAVYLLNKLKIYPHVKVTSLILKEMNSLWVEIKI
ncbi:MAG: 6-carboxytetrahydropterin synthase [Bdellovibrionaceae bacterium]|nr:6-carboxytetrahydropterin synthase [Pseudobdellovibrionaceae bacterium]NUM58166.1 6-carboxytetrahydropterin synthase [Pseudobdellovibrionaceae bacterium]